MVFKKFRIAPEHHVVRHCRHRHTIRKHGKIVGVHPDHFSLRVKEGKVEGYLSSQHYECFEGSPLEKMSCAMSATPINPGPKDAFSRICVGHLEAQGHRVNRSLRAERLRLDGYSGIFGLSNPPNNELNAALAAFAVVQVVSC